MTDLALAMLHGVTVAVASTGATGAGCPRCTGKAFVTEPSSGVIVTRAFHTKECPLVPEIHDLLTENRPLQRRV